MLDSPHIIIEVAIPLPLEKTFHYAVPTALTERIQVGVRVLVPFGRRKVTGYVLALLETSDESLKEIVEVLDQEPLLIAAELEFFRWAASYYFHPLGEVLKCALPTGINIETKRRKKSTATREETPEGGILTGGRGVKEEMFYDAAEVLGTSGEIKPRKGGERRRTILEYVQSHGKTSATVLRRECGASATVLKNLVNNGLLTGEVHEVYRDPFRGEEFGTDTPLTLNKHQEIAVGSITTALQSGLFAPFLLHGVTGSGKTEVYLQSIAGAIATGKTALVLVPEIALTPQLVKRFKRRFTCGIAVLHSGLGDGERYDEWRRIRRNEVAIVIGARSAIFAPLRHMGIIVVDEEHESSFKQSEGFRYNARDLALVRAQKVGATIVLGSATPLVTSWHACDSGRMTLLSLPERVRNLPMPETEVVDMRRSKGVTFSPRLQLLMTENLAAGGQTLLFLNRRGFATWVVCQECGEVLRCPNCAVTLTFHQGRRRHYCHYCDYSIPAPSVCPACDSIRMELLGRGTERLEEEVSALLPSARLDRLDRDTTSGRGGHARILRRVEDGSLDILVGTQMIAKGHDFPGVTLVGVISADDSLHLPDFRSAERTFQVISQVMGRAGRGDQPGRVVIQSALPEHYAISLAAIHDYDGFYAQEIAFRRELSYPPFTFLAGVNLSSTNATAVEQEARNAATTLQLVKRELKSRVQILGPASAPLAKVRGRFRWQLLLKGTSRPELHRLLHHFRARVRLPALVRLAIDVDPVDML